MQHYLRLSFFSIHYIDYKCMHNL
uniref:Uncharacterized protein n=1 Tax=Anguilla anguilla TaxID=7936 RepID=A0A0E9S6X3_ANGAN